MARSSRISALQFAVLAGLVTVSGFVGGLVAGRLGSVRDAQADERPSTTNIFVGPQGLAFRGTDGRVLARLSGDSNGGVFEIYNANEQPGARIRAGSFGGSIDAFAAPRPVAVTPAVTPPLGQTPTAVAGRDLGF